MAVRMNWGWETDGIARANFATIDDAVTSLAASMKRAAARYGDERQPEVLRDCATPMSTRMCTEGVRALAEGRTWKAECGGLFVTLIARAAGGGLG